MSEQRKPPGFPEDTSVDDRVRDETRREALENVTKAAQGVTTALAEAREAGRRDAIHMSRERVMMIRREAGAMARRNAFEETARVCRDVSSECHAKGEIPEGWGAELAENRIRALAAQPPPETAPILLRLEPGWTDKVEDYIRSLEFSSDTNRLLVAGNIRGFAAHLVDGLDQPPPDVVVKDCDDCPYMYDPEPELHGLRCVHPAAPSEDPAPLNDLCRLPGMDIDRGKGRTLATPPERCPLRSGPIVIRLKEVS